MASKEGQDLWALELLKFKRGGFFLDSGAGDPFDGSNTVRMEQEYSWKGILVEPVRHVYDRLLKHRLAQVYNVVLNDRMGAVPFYEAGNWPLSGIYGHLTDEAKARNGADPSRVQQREGWTLAHLFEKAGAPGVIDYWSLDTEGSEWVLVQSFPWNTHKVQIIAIEHNFEEPKRTLIREFLTAKGYTYVYREVTPADDNYHLLIDP